MFKERQDFHALAGGPVQTTRETPRQGSPEGGTFARVAAWHRGLSRGRKVIFWVFVIWAAQAVPKWTAAIVADGETSAAIMKVLVPPR
jgi:hypothetical protein